MHARRVLRLKAPKMFIDKRKQDPKALLFTTGALDKFRPYTHEYICCHPNPEQELQETYAYQRRVYSGS